MNVGDSAVFKTRVQVKESNYRSSSTDTENADPSFFRKSALSVPKCSCQIDDADFD